VEAEMKDGKVRVINVIPESRKQDLLILLK